MLYDGSTERFALEEKLSGSERNERCARGAVWLMAVLTGLAFSGLGYAAILMEDFSSSDVQMVIRIICAVGLASFISLLAFIAFWMMARKELKEQRHRCRRLARRMVEARLGKPASLSGIGGNSSLTGDTEFLKDETSFQRRPSDDH